MVNIANGVNTLHKSDVIHKNVKPQNIIASIDNKFKSTRILVNQFVQLLILVIQ